MFGSDRNAILATRPRGDTSRLPIELDISTSAWVALPKAITGAVIGVLGLMLYGRLPAQTAFGEPVATLFRFAPLVLAIAGALYFVRGAVRLADRRSVRIADGQVTVTGKSLFGSEDWTEPLSAFEGVRWREIVVYRRTGPSTDRPESRRPRVYQVLDLKHPDPARCVPLHVTRLNELPRAEWEHLAKLLGVPAIDATGAETQVRAAEDVDKSVKELAHEGKIEADWQERPAPPGLEVVHEGDATAPAGQAIHVTIRAPRFPLWLFGALLAFGTFLCIVGLSDLAFMPILFGGALVTAVVWFWRYEQRNPRSVRITRTAVELHTPTPGNAPTHVTVPHGDIEGVNISSRKDKQSFGKQLRIVTDRDEHVTGSGLSDDALAWLRDLVVSAVAKA